MKWLDEQKRLQHLLLDTRVAHVIEVEACEQCPHYSSEHDLMGTCYHRAIWGGSGRELPDDRGPNEPPPAWCPLRERPTLLRLSTRP